MFNLARSPMTPPAASPRVVDLRDHAAFSRAYAQHARGVYAAAMGVLGDPARAQDVVQDVFLRLWRRPEAFDMRRGALGPYLRVMARSRALDVLREGRASDRVGDRLRFATDRLEPALDARLAPERHDVRLAVRALPDGQREAVVLTYWAGLTAEEVARHADVPLGTAKSRVRLGVRRLRAAYAGDDVAAAEGGARRAPGRRREPSRRGRGRGRARAPARARPIVARRLRSQRVLGSRPCRSTRPRTSTACAARAAPSRRRCARSPAASVRG